MANEVFQKIPPPPDLSKLRENTTLLELNGTIALYTIMDRNQVLDLWVMEEKVALYDPSTQTLI